MIDTMPNLILDRKLDPNHSHQNHKEHDTYIYILMAVAISFSIFSISVFLLWFPLNFSFGKLCFSDLADRFHFFVILLVWEYFSAKFLCQYKLCSYHRQRSKKDLTLSMTLEKSSTMCFFEALIWTDEQLVDFVFLRSFLEAQAFLEA